MLGGGVLNPPTSDSVSGLGASEMPWYCREMVRSLSVRTKMNGTARRLGRCSLSTVRKRECAASVLAATYKEELKLSGHASQVVRAGR